MNTEKWIEMLNDLQEFRSQLDGWGVNTGSLIIVAFVSGVVFLFSLREVLGWFLRVPHLRAEIRSLNRQLAEAKQLLKEVNGKLDAEGKTTVSRTEAAPEPEEGENSYGGRPQFRLDH
jgi:hypothetical protein